MDRMTKTGMGYALLPEVLPLAKAGPPQWGLGC